MKNDNEKTKIENTLSAIKKIGKRTKKSQIKICGNYFYAAVESGILVKNGNGYTFGEGYSANNSTATAIVASGIMFGRKCHSDKNAATVKARSIKMAQKELTKRSKRSIAEPITKKWETGKAIVIEIKNPYTIPTQEEVRKNRLDQLKAVVQKCMEDKKKINNDWIDELNGINY